MEELIIIFVKNAVAGKVKTRLASDIGDLQALRLYLKMLERTKNIALGVPATRWVFYSEMVEEEDRWDNGEFEKYVQQGEDLGERIKQAFQRGYEAGFTKICIIGSDCWELTSHHVNEAFKALDQHEFVVGPAHDGGYYLLGMTQLYESLFANISWSTDQVLPATLKEMERIGQEPYLLETLFDIDTKKDLERFPELQ